MAASSQVKMLRDRMDFDYSRGVTDYVFMLTRLITGCWFFHAGVTRIVSGPPNAAGYLTNAPAASPLQSFFAWAAATPWLLDLTNVMVPWDRFLIGLGLIMGTLVRLTAFFGGVLMVFFYLRNAEWDHGVVDDDLFGLVMLIIVDTLAAGRILGPDAIIEKMEFVRQHPALKYLLG